jgi:hypothetical protein
VDIPFYIDSVGCAYYVELILFFSPFFVVFLAPSGGKKKPLKQPKSEKKELTEV